MSFIYKANSKMSNPESVYQMPGDTTKFYAAFTTGASDGLVGSAICTYTMDDIQEAFAGRFKEQVSTRTLLYN